MHSKQKETRRKWFYLLHTLSAVFEICVLRYLSCSVSIVSVFVCTLEVGQQYSLNVLFVAVYFFRAHLCLA